MIVNGTATFDGTNYALKQFHFHTPSEHRIDEEYFPLEMHMVHQATGPFPHPKTKCQKKKKLAANQSTRQLKPHCRPHRPLPTHHQRQHDRPHHQRNQEPSRDRHPGHRHRNRPAGLHLADSAADDRAAPPVHGLADDAAVHRGRPVPDHAEAAAAQRRDLQRAQVRHQVQLALHAEQA